MPKQKFRRRKWLINDEIQVGLAVRLSLLLVGYLTLFSLISLVDPIYVLLTAKAGSFELAAAKNEIGGFAGGIFPVLLMYNKGQVIGLRQT